MKSIICTDILIFLFLYIPITNAQIKVAEFKQEKAIMNPYVEFNLKNTKKIEVQMFKIINNRQGFQQRILLNKHVYSVILNEFDKEIEYVKDGCFCIGDGKIFFTLNDDSEVEFRLKHGGGTLEYKFGDMSKIRHFEMSETFVELIRKFYSDEDRHYYEIQDRHDSGKIPRMQYEKELEEHRRLYPNH